PRPATFAAGTVLVEGLPQANLAADLELASSDGTIVNTTALAIIGPDGTVSIPVVAAAAGTLANIEAGIQLKTVLPLPAVSRVTVAAPASTIRLGSAKSFPCVRCASRPTGSAGD